MCAQHYFVEASVDAANTLKSKLFLSTENSSFFFL